MGGRLGRWVVIVAAANQTLQSRGGCVQALGAHLDTASEPRRRIVWSSAFTRLGARIIPNRLKAELQTGAASRCAAAP